MVVESQSFLRLQAAHGQQGMPGPVRNIQLLQEVGWQPADAVESDVIRTSLLACRHVVVGTVQPTKSYGGALAGSQVLARDSEDEHTLERPLHDAGNLCANGAIISQ